MNRGQKLIGNLSAQEIFLLAAAGIFFTLVLVVIVIDRASGPRAGRSSWLNEIISGGLQQTSTPVSPFSTNHQPVHVIPPVIEINCTYPSGYWSEHTEVWAIENIVVGQASFSKARILELLNDESGEPNNELYKQFFTAALNTMKGAEAEVIDEVLGRTRRWLEAAELGSQLSREEVLDVLIMAEALKGYNAGVIGPGRCEFQEVVVLPTPTPIILPPVETQAPDQGNLPTPTPTLAPTQSLPSATPTPPPPATATQAPPIATATATRTQAAVSTATPRSSPTSAPLPGATATSTSIVLPTSAPPPTDRPEPTATATLTDVPTPTTAPTATEAPSATLEPSPTQTNLPDPTAIPTSTEAPTDLPPPTATSTPDLQGIATDPVPTGAPPPPGPVDVRPTRRPNPTEAPPSAAPTNALPTGTAPPP